MRLILLRDKGWPRSWSGTSTSDQRLGHRVQTVKPLVLQLPVLRRLFGNVFQIVIAQVEP